MSNDLFAGIGVVPGTFLLPRPDANWTAWNVLSLAINKDNKA